MFRKVSRKFAISFWKTNDNLRSLFNFSASARRNPSFSPRSSRSFGFLRRHHSVSDWGVNINVRKRGAATQSGVVLFSVMRNEHYFLPHFLDHYRAMGVAEFCIYADRCDPETIDLLASEPDVTIVEGDREFGETFGRQFNGIPRRLPTLLKEMLSDELFPGRWVLVVDADEFLVLPPPLTQIDELVGRLDKAGQHYSYAPMVDFYPRNLAMRNTDRTQGPFQSNEYFDKGPYHRWDGKMTPFQFRRGLRSRLIEMQKEQFPGELRSIYGKHPISPPKDYKFPLVKQGKGLRRGGSHNVVGAKPSSRLSTGLAHFKIYPDLDKKIASALSERQYYNASLEYRFLKLAIDNLAEVSLVFEGTRRFEGAQSFVDAGLLQALD
jgi:hypothetical protein